MRRITLQTDFLEEAEFYRVVVEANTPGSFVGFSEIFVAVPQRPYGGQCSSSPRQIRGKTEFC